jgi:tripartite-type tricarboxylate transporter receptor subunit TctC
VTRIFAGLIVLAAWLCGSAIAPAQEWPSRPVKIIIPLGPGGGGDVFTRLMAEDLHKRLGQPFIVENRPGGGLNIGTRACAEAAPDGYTICVLSGEPVVYNQFTFKNLPYNPEKDFEPIVNLFINSNALVVNSSLNVKTIPELVALAKAKPGTLSFGSYGTGSSNHLVAELLNTMAGIETNHIPYRGSAPMMTDLIGGRIQFAFDGIAVTLGYIRGNTIRLLGVSTSKRSPVLPDEPTIAESAVPGFESSVWFGLFAPAGTPKAVVDLLNSKVNAALAPPEVREGFLKVGNEPVGGGPDVLAAKVQIELQKWTTIVREKNIRIEQ